MIGSTGVVVVTGGSSGVGRASARAFADAGRPVAVLARGPESLDATVAELRVRGVPALGLPVDVTDRVALDAAANEVEATLGPIDVWVNSAMVTVMGSFTDVTPEDFARVVDVVFGGTANGTRTALRAMRPRDRGRIIQVGSSLAYRGIPLQSAYCSAKHAVQGLTDSLRAELLAEDSGIRIIEVNLPAVNTPQFDMCRSLLGTDPQPVPPIFQPEVAAEAVVRAAATAERTVHVSWVTTRTVLADRLVPGALDRLLADTGFDSQVRRDGPPAPDADNLYAPLPGDHGCHGSFDDHARSRSLQESLRHTPAGAVARGAGAVGRRVGGKLLRLLM